MGHVARVGESRDAYRVLVGKSEDPGVDGRIILKLNLQEVRWLLSSRRVVTGLLTQCSEFNPNPVGVGFVVYQEAFRFSLPSSPSLQ